MSEQQTGTQTTTQPVQSPVTKAAFLLAVHYLSQALQLDEEQQTEIDALKQQVAAAQAQAGITLTDDESAFVNGAIEQAAAAFPADDSTTPTVPATVQAAADATAATVNPQS